MATKIDGAANKTWHAEPPSPHDLRRTVATRLSQMGTLPETVSAILNHTRGDVTGRHYDHYQRAPEKRAALDAWAAAVTEIVEGNPATWCGSAPRREKTETSENSSPPRPPDGAIQRDTGPAQRCLQREQRIAVYLDETAEELHRMAEALLVTIGETTPQRIVEACGADRTKMFTEMRDLATRLNSKYGIFSPAACAGKWLVTRHLVVMSVFDLLAQLGDSEPDRAAVILDYVDSYADAWHWWHAELKGEHISAAAKVEETDRLRKQGRTTRDKGEIRAKIIRAAIDKLPRPLSSIKAIARDIRASVDKLFIGEGLLASKSDRAFYQEVRRAVGEK